MVTSEIDIHSISKAITRDLPFGLWCADFNNKTIIGYNKFCNLLDLSNDTITFDKIKQCIREDYKNIVLLAFSELQGKDNYEITFPTNHKWIKLKLTHYDATCNKAYGYIIESSNENEKNNGTNDLSAIIKKENQIIKQLFEKINVNQYEIAINEILEEIRNTTKADRVSIIEYDNRNQTISCTYESTIYGIEPRYNLIKNINYDIIDWINDEIKHNQIYIYDLDQLPTDKHIQIDVLCCHKVKSILIQPLKCQEKITGFIILDFIKKHHIINNIESEWINTLSQAIELCFNLSETEKRQKSETERFNNVLDLSPFGHLHLKIVYNQNNEPNDLLIISTNKTFEQMLKLENIKGKYISQIFEKETQHIIEICNSVVDTGNNKIIDDFIFFKGQTLSAKIIMSNYNEFICQTTFNTNLLYNNEISLYSTNSLIENREIQHKIRTHLNAVIGFAELLATDNNEQNKSKYMEIIKENAQSLIDSSYKQNTIQDNLNKQEINLTMENESTHKKRILIAEDTESNYMLVSYILKNIYDIKWAHDGVEALEMYEKEKPDLILMDVRMPRLGGLSATSRIRETDKETPIIALTAFAFESDRAKTLEAGCTDFLAKPIKASVLKEIIAKYINK